MKHLVIYLRLILGLIILLSSSYPLLAQQEKETLGIIQNTSEENFGSLNIGNKIPDLKFNNVLNYKNKTIKLSDFKGKPILLDFWATWCLSCATSFPKIESLQEKYKNQLQILLVNYKGTGDNKEKVINFFEKRRNKNGEKYKLITITNDTILGKLFPCRSIPHYVWIGSDGIVKAITSSEYITESNLEKLTKNEELSLPIKRDIDAKRPLYLEEGIGLNDFLHFSIFIKGRIEGLPISYRNRIDKNVLRGIAMTNLPALHLYRKAAYKLIDGFNDKMIQLEVEDSSRLIFDKKKADKQAWYTENVYSYELILPAGQIDKLESYLLEDLNRYSDFIGEIKKVKTKCLILVRTSGVDKLQSKGGNSEYRLYGKERSYIKNLPLKRILLKLNNIEAIGLQIIDETNYINNVDFEFQNPVTNLTELKKELNRYDLDLVEGIRELDMLVIKDKKPKPLSESKQISTK